MAPTRKTVTFKQSLLMRKKDAVKIAEHSDLSCAYIVGAVRGTTGEERYLAQSGIIDSIDLSHIAKGVTVVMEDKSFIASDGTLKLSDPAIKERAWLLPPDCSLPATRYFVAEDTMIPALKEGHIDAVARGYIGNKLIADRSGGEWVVGAIFSLECPKQESVRCAKKEEAVFFAKLDDTKLLEKLDAAIAYLTDDGKIDYDDWEKDPQVFLKRAKQEAALHLKF